jgi:hypothetical protein
MFSGVNGLPPPPPATFQQMHSHPKSNSSPETIAQSSHQSSRHGRHGSRSGTLPDDEAFWGAEVQKIYDEFLREERAIKVAIGKNVCTTASEGLLANIEMIMDIDPGTITDLLVPRPHAVSAIERIASVREKEVRKDLNVEIGGDQDHRTIETLENRETGECGPLVPADVLVTRPSLSMHFHVVLRGTFLICKYWLLTMSTCKSEPLSWGEILKLT